MITIRGLIDNINSAYERINRIDTVITKVAEEKNDVLLSLNRDQMLSGRDTDGNSFTPGYTDDPYFKTKEKAESYKRMKEGLEVTHRGRIRFSNAQLYPNKDSNTPNLIITGPFQDNMFINTSPTAYEIGSSYTDSNDIESKYNNKVFGLAPKSKEYFWENFLLPELKQFLKL